MAEIKITRRDFPLVFERQTTEVHKIVVTRLKGFILEMEEFHFHFDSAVMLPDYDVAEAAADHITALTVFATGLAQARKFSTRKTMIAGHTDTSGAADYNVKLSQQASPTSASARTRSKTIPANPAPSTTATATALPPPLRTSRRHITPSSTALSPITATCDKATWEAFFDLYNQAIAKFLSTDVEGLAAYRAALKWVDPGRKTVGCGEN